MPEFDLDECRRICEAATPGPWSSWDDIFDAECDGDPNERFCYYARTALPAACQEIERLRKDVERLTDGIKRSTFYMTDLYAKWNAVPDPVKAGVEGYLDSERKKVLTSSVSQPI